jgi:hypothetical protein
VFATPGGTICLWIELTTAVELHPDSRLIESDIPAEGDVLLF